MSKREKKTNNNETVSLAILSLDFLHLLFCDKCGINCIASHAGGAGDAVFARGARVTARDCAGKRVSRFFD